jgi:ABC-type molybdate transport system permease subunit
LFRVDGVFCATIALALPQSLEPVRVAAFSAEEAAQGGADAWGASELSTFRHAMTLVASQIP